MTTTIKSVRALVALSNPQAAKGAKDYFRNRANFVAMAEDKREAQELINTYPFNMIIIDDRFPDVGGLDFARYLRFLGSPISFARILFGVHEAERRLVLDARNAGVDKIIKLPMTLGLLEKSVNTLLQDNRPFINATGYVGPDRRVKDQGSARERRIDQEGIVDAAIVKRSRMLGVDA